MLKLNSVLALLCFSLLGLNGASAAPDATKPKAAAEGKEEAPAELDSPDRWPTQVPVPKNMRLRPVSERKAGVEGFSYQSNNYMFTSAVELDEASLEAVGRLFECAYAANKAMAKVLPIPRAKGNRPSRDKFKATLYKDMESYYASGGSPGSSGVFKYSFNPRVKKFSEKTIGEDRVHVPFPSMGLGADGKVKDANFDSHVLVHELTHQCFCFNQLPVWANEGFAEYAGYVPYDGEVLDFEKCFEEIVAVGKKRSARTLTYPFTLEEFLVMEKDEMYEFMNKGVDTYYLSVICVAYYVHLADRLGVRALKSYMNDLYRGKDNEKVVKKIIGRHKKGESLQKKFLEAWAKHGVIVKFAEEEEGGKKKKKKK